MSWETSGPTWILQLKKAKNKQKKVFSGQQSQRLHVCFVISFHHFISPAFYRCLQIPVGHVSTCQEWRTEASWTSGMHLGGAGGHSQTTHHYTFLQQPHKRHTSPRPLRLISPTFGGPTFHPTIASGGQERSSTSKEAEGAPWPEHGLLGAVWSSREASDFHRCLIERDDEAGEAPGRGPSYEFGLCSPADFAVSVKRLLGHHQSQSS